MSPVIRHPCPCCGYRTYPLPAGGTMQLCPVCFWEDAPGHVPFNGSNEVSLVQGQRHFLAEGVCETRFKNAARAPLPEEARSPHWLSFDMLCERIIAEIERSFHNVTRGGGTTLHQMDLVDGGWPILEKFMKEAENKDPEIRWQDIPAGKLSQFHESLCFLDHLGFRFYLPAFLRHALVTSYPDIGAAEICGVLWSLDDGFRNSYRSDSFSLLELEQKQAVAAFLQLFAVWGNDDQEPYARKGLKRGWDAYVPPYIKLAAL